MQIRYKAFQILCKVVLEDGYSQLELKKQLVNEEELDARFITNLVYGTLQNYYYMEYIYKKYTKKLDDDRLGVLLCMALYEIKEMNSPSYAVVNEACEIAKKMQNRYGGFVNAVLRKVIRDGFAIEESDPITYQAIETSIPLWLYKMWVKHYGEDVAKKIAKSANEKAYATCRYNRLKTTKKELIEEYGFKEGKLSEDSLYLENGLLASLDCFKDGRISIQDEASQMVAILTDPKPNDIVLDVCAAPGTKTTHMAERMGNQGHIIAQDIYESRVKLIEEGCKRIGIDIIEAKMQDATKVHEIYEKESFDVVLVDAPCSGLGVLSRKPDIRVHARQDSLDEILALQKAILESVSGLVKVNGKLTYSTCSLNKKENEKQIEDFLKNHMEYELISQRTIFPFEYHTDGFFICLMKRVK